MSSWTRITFEAGVRSVDELAVQLRSAVDDPETVERDGYLVWKETQEFERESLYDLDVDAPRALVVEANDTSSAGSGYLYERVEGSFVLVDTIAGSEGFIGRDVVYYVQREHGFVGVNR